ESGEDCSLPCFADIRPDETTLPEIREMVVELFAGDDSILARFDKPFERDDGLLDYTLWFNSPDISGSFQLGFIILPEEEVLRRFHARLSHPANWLESTNLDISEVLAALGMPDEVFI